MSDRTEMITGGGESGEGIITPEMLTEAGDALSKSLLFTLGRDYLNEPVLEKGQMRLTKISPPDQPDVAFMEIEQIGRAVEGNPTEYFTAIQTTLAACHDPRYKLVFVISSDGLHSQIFIGIAGQEPGTQPKFFASQLGQFLCANWPGTKVKIVEDYTRVVDKIHVPLSNYRYARAFTGIPSQKANEKQAGYPQTLDRFMRGLRGKPYLYMVVAEPMAETQVSEVVSACHTLSGQLHAFTKATINRSTSTSTSETLSHSESSTTSETESSSDSKTEGETGSKGALGTALDQSEGKSKLVKGVGLGGLSALLVAAGGPFLLSGMLGMFGQLLPSSGTSASTSTSTSTSESASSTLGESTSSGTTSGESMSYSQEYLNKHAEACERLLDQTAVRFETAKSKGCWNVGIYLVSDNQEAVSQGQAQLKALISGESSFYEPVRAHNLAPVWDGQVQVALDAYQHPGLKLFSPQDDKLIHHPLGDVFAGLTTPMNTDELSLVANLPIREMPGLPLQPTAFFSLNPPRTKSADSAFNIGTVLEGGEPIQGLTYDVEIDLLTRHIFITGITGSGKSNTCRRLIQSLMEHGKNFLVIEPAKDEYVQLALAYNQAGTFDREIAVYMPGRKEWGGESLEDFNDQPV